jgi:hypothetical protein
VEVEVVKLGPATPEGLAYGATKTLADLIWIADLRALRSSEFRRLLRLAHDEGLLDECLRESLPASSAARSTRPVLRSTSVGHEAGIVEV